MEENLYAQIRGGMTMTTDLDEEEKWWPSTYFAAIFNIAGKVLLSLGKNSLHAVHLLPLSYLGVAMLHLFDSFFNLTLSHLHLSLLNKILWMFLLAILETLWQVYFLYSKKTYIFLITFNMLKKCQACPIVIYARNR
ncbi:hypothetical protein ACJX0J_030834, partial [Zea mays]